MIHTDTIKLTTAGTGEVHDLTESILMIVSDSGFTGGTVTVFCPGSTGAITTIEYEPGMLKDIPEFLEKIIPSDRSYHHDDTWHDGNGFSHLRASLIGPDITIPILAGRPHLGTWQQVVFLECDNKPHQRELIVQVMGE